MHEQFILTLGGDLKTTLMLDIAQQVLAIHFSTLGI